MGSLKRCLAFAGSCKNTKALQHKNETRAVRNRQMNRKSNPLKIPRATVPKILTWKARLKKSQMARRCQARMNLAIAKRAANRPWTTPLSPQRTGKGVQITKILLYNNVMYIIKFALA